MDKMPDVRELGQQLTLVKKDMEIMKADLSATLEGFRTDAERRDKEAIQRDKANIQWIAGLVLGTAILIIAVLGLLIRWPASPV